MNAILNLFVSTINYMATNAVSSMSLMGMYQPELDD